MRDRLPYKDRGEDRDQLSAVDHPVAVGAEARILGEAGPVERGAALYALEGDFGFSKANATNPAPEVGHEVKLINFGQQAAGSGDDDHQGGKPLTLKIQRFAHNKEFEQSFVSGSSGFNRPTNVKFGPDGCAYVVDYGAVRDFGQSSPEAKFITDGDGPLVQIPGTGVIWKICATK